jgi:hypothetical protein
MPLPPTTVVELGPAWELVKGVLLFVITGLLGVVAKGFWKMSKMVVDHELAIYGRSGENGLTGGLRDVKDSIDLMKDRFVAMDAVVEAERATYPGPDRRHSALHVIVERVRQELLDEERRRQRGEQD